MEQQDTAEANRQAILNSPSYQLAEFDIDFLKRNEIRHVRMQLELLKTETLLRDNNGRPRSSSSAARIMPQDRPKRGSAKPSRRPRKPPRSACQARRRSGPSGSSPRATSTTKPASSAGSSRPPARSTAATIS